MVGLFLKTDFIIISLIALIGMFLLRVIPEMYDKLLERLDETDELDTDDYVLIFSSDNDLLTTRDIIDVINKKYEDEPTE